jgi:hypothetical protein
MSLLRADLLLRRPAVLPVKLPDGEKIFVLELSNAAWQRIKDSADVDAVAVASVVCDENGNLQFNAQNPDDVKACGEIPLADSNAIIACIKERAAGKSKEDLAKKYGASTNTDSASA